jgi:RNA polymerase sigma-70 factor, ECF subfamily
VDDGRSRRGRGCLSSFAGGFGPGAAGQCAPHAEPNGRIHGRCGVQETLLAIHLHRNTWRQTNPIGPWIAAIARYKLIDSLRRRGRRTELAINDMINVLPDGGADQEEELSRRQVMGLADRLKGRQGEIVRSISLEGADIAETAARFKMSEGAVRVALHRGLKALAQLYRARDG